MKAKEPLLIIVPLIICAVAVVIAFNSTIKVRKLKRSSDETFLSLKNEITKLAGEIKNINENLTKQSKKVGFQAADGGTGQTKDWLNLLDSDLQRIEETLSKTGLDQLATNNMDPVMLKEMFTEFSEKKELQTFQDELVSLNFELHEDDKNKYDPEIAQLYKDARTRGQKNDKKIREDAYNTLLKKYPDANATGMLIAEKALRSGFRGKLEDTEKYYKQLTDNDNFQNIVTDWGIDAVPTIQYQLASRYIKEGRVDDARKIISELEAGSSDGFMLVPGKGRRPDWKKTSQAIIDLNNKAYK